MSKRLIFIYNADSGMFNTLTDIAHKIFSPDTYSCNLCAISHSYFSERDEWKAFITNLEVECEFLHRDEYQNHYSFALDSFPAILVAENDQLSTCLDAAAINACQDMEELQAAIRQCI